MPWNTAFLEFENVLGGSYKTTWQEVLTEHFPEPLESEETGDQDLLQKRGFCQSDGPFY